MVDVIDETEAERLLQPGNLGLRLFMVIGRSIPENEYSLGSEDELIAELKGMDHDERQEALQVILAVEQGVVSIVVERGGDAPELWRS